MPREASAPRPRGPSDPARLSDREIAEEGLDRLRRVETRLTRFMADNGFDTQSQKPRFVLTPMKVKYIEAPSQACAFSELVKVIPPHIGEGVAVPVFVKGSLVGYVARPPVS